MEWIFIKTYLKTKEEDNLWKKLDDVCFSCLNSCTSFNLFILKASNRKVGYICSWISIMSQLTPFIDDKKLVYSSLFRVFSSKFNSFLFKVSYFKKLVSLVLSQVLSPNFHIRTYAEATLLKIHLISNDDKNKTKLNGQKFKEHEEIKPLLSVIYSIIKDIIDEYECL